MIKYYIELEPGVKRLVSRKNFYNTRDYYIAADIEHIVDRLVTSELDIYFILSRLIYEVDASVNSARKVLESELADLQRERSLGTSTEASIAREVEISNINRYSNKNT